MFNFCFDFLKRATTLKFLFNWIRYKWEKITASFIHHKTRAMIVIGNGHETAIKNTPYSLILQIVFGLLLSIPVTEIERSKITRMFTNGYTAWTRQEVVFFAGFSMVRIKQDSPVYLCTNLEDWFWKDDLPTNKPYRPWIPNMTVWKWSNVLLEVKLLSIISPAVFKRKL